MIVHDLDVLRARGRPTEADAELMVYADTMLARAIPFEWLESITGRYAQIVQAGGDLQLSKLTSRNSRDVREPLDPLALRKGLRIGAFERPDHSAIVTRCVISVKRRMAAKSTCAL